MDESCRIEIRVKPQAKRNSIALNADGAITASLTSPPVDGKANQHLIKLLSKTLGVPKSACAIVRGQTARNKIVEIQGLSVEKAHGCLKKGS